MTKAAFNKKRASWLHRASNNVETFYYQLMHIMLKNTELLKHSKITLQHVSVWARGSLVVKALRYKPAGRGFDSRWCHRNFSVT